MLGTNNNFAKTLKLSQMSMGASLKRHSAISDNIANVDTPHYKKKEVLFEAELNRALNKKANVPFLTTSDRHISINNHKHYSDVKSRIWRQYDTNHRNDKNNVDIEKESSDLVKNTLHYNMLTTIVNNQFKKIKSVLT